MQKVLNAIRKVRFTKSTLRQASILVKERIIVWKNKGRCSSAKSLRSKNRGSVPRRNCTTTAMCPKQGFGSCQKYLQAQRERQGYILLFVVPGISASSSSTRLSSASSPSSSQESISANSDSVSDRGMNEQLRGDPLHDSQETEK